ncbi:ribonuclease HII [Thiomicrospira microaerophila]|uniref:ribonuclease HII n=1 Tax=Thiomicrospira microaerophila TaxID=406020 RepID=UPI0005C9D926|nr:ribonuclease HII [Thiomicrospira microaerophila]
MDQADLFNQPFASPLVTDFIVGVDEVGRGPLIGEVVAAAVILPADCDLPLKDSKKLSHQKRVLLAEKIKQQALDFAIVGVSPAQIDQLNILQATMLAMKLAIAQLSHPFSQVLVDGNRCPEIDCPCQPIIKGDGLIPAISAASILAKVYRDQQMDELHQRYPEYGFDQHKGYPTAAHLAAIQKHGLIEGYRKSFKPVKALLSPK